MWPAPVAGSEIRGWSALDRRARRLALVVALVLAGGSAALAYASARTGAGAPPLYGAAAGAAGLWVDDGSGYRRLPTTGAGPGSNAADMAYDRVRAQLVLWDHGCAKLVMGFTGGCVSRVNATWTWDGRSWTAHPSRLTPQEAEGGAMLFDAGRGEVLYINGRLQAWSWTGTSWVSAVLGAGGPQTAPAGQAPLAGFLTGYDESAGRLVVATASATWTWDGKAWASMAGAIDLTEAGSDRHLVYDPANRSLLYAGRTSTWTGRGGAWVRHSQPFDGSGASAFDGRQGQVVHLQEDTRACDRQGCLTNRWTWDGSAWTSAGPPAAPLLPLSRSLSAPPPVVFDEARGSTTVFVAAT